MSTRLKLFFICFILIIGSIPEVYGIDTTKIGVVEGDKFVFMEYETSNNQEDMFITEVTITIEDTSVRLSTDYDEEYVMEVIYEDGSVTEYGEIRIYHEKLFTEGFTPDYIIFTDWEFLEQNRTDTLEQEKNLGNIISYSIDNNEVSFDVKLHLNMTKGSVIETLIAHYSFEKTTGVLLYFSEVGGAISTSGEFDDFTYNVTKNRIETSTVERGPINISTVFGSFVLLVPIIYIKRRKHFVLY